MNDVNREFDQCFSIVINSENHDSCLEASKPIKKQCEAWSFNVRFTEHKSARKGTVLRREIMIYQRAYPNDIIIFKEAIRRVCFHLDLYFEPTVKFIDRGAVPVDEKIKRL